MALALNYGAGGPPNSFLPNQPEQYGGMEAFQQLGPLGNAMPSEPPSYPPHPDLPPLEQVYASWHPRPAPMYQTGFDWHSSYPREIDPILLPSGEEANPYMQSLIEVDFYQGETPLGLVIDWSMALPVVAEILPKSPAAQRPEIRPRFVLIGVNEERIGANPRRWLPGTKREDIESLLSRLQIQAEAPPLLLLFEDPEPSFIPEAVAEDNAARERKRRQLAKAQSTLMATGLRALEDKKNAPSMSKSYFRLHPERAPLTRFGMLGDPPPSNNEDVTSFPSRQPVRRESNLTPAVSFSQLPRIPSALAPNRNGELSAQKSDVWRQSVMLSRAMRSFTQGGGRSRTQTQGADPLGTSASFFDAMGAPRHDPCYEDLGAGPFGPGHPRDWPQLHETDYLCRIGDMVLCQRMSEAYPIGFRGRKRDRPTIAQIQFGEDTEGGRRRHTNRVEEIWCDVCGLQIGDPSVPECAGPCFYYCKLCKKHGNRYEMCLACHAIEILQGEAKHDSERGLHPHFEQCAHRGLVKRKDLKLIYPGMHFLRKAFCDFCGNQITKLGLPGAPGHSEGGKIYSCPRCPEQHQGLRFELCGTCADELQQRGVGFQRLGF
jgi:hypothetical protein